MPASLHWRLGGGEGGRGLDACLSPLEVGRWGGGRLCYLMCINFDDHHVHDIMYMYMVVSPAELQVHHEGENHTHPLPSLLLQQPGTTCTYCNIIHIYMYMYIHMLMHGQQG